MNKPTSAARRPTATHVAEWVSLGHPDRLADAIAERIVQHALVHDARALVGVEVAVHRRRAFVDGRVAARGIGPAERWLRQLVRAAFAHAGYGGPWRPAPDEIEVIEDLCVDDLRDDERQARAVSDDQNVVIGWAGRDARTAFLPPAHFLAAELGARLAAWRREHAASDFGPDFKLLPQLDELHDGSFRWRRLTLSILHRPGLGYETQHRLLFPVLRQALERHERAGLRGVAATLAPSVVHVNGAGGFEVGGPMGDNGLSGKKLVVDHYGPDVPIGGGACYGKDPHKVDRCGPMRARQWALELVGAGAREARTRLVWSPGDAAPALVEAEVRDAAGVWHRVPEMSQPPAEWFAIEAIVADFGRAGSPGFDPPGAFAGGVVPVPYASPADVEAPLACRR
jgi:S-adenosylmethionine synthetase